MAKKSRLEQDERERQFEEEMGRHPMSREIRQFLENRRVAIDQASGLLYIMSMMASFMIYRSIKKHAQLPVLQPEEEKADKDRMERLGRILGHECRQLNIEFHEIMDELVLPMAGNKALMEPILNKIYDMLDSLIPSESFRQPTQEHIENPELWGDRLVHYADRKEDYFEAVKELFTLVLAIVRSGGDEELKEMDHGRELEEIRETYGIKPEDFQKLRRRATEFFKIAFAKYLSMVFEPVRQEVDEKTSEPTSA